MQYLSLFLKGLAMGAANVIPGVSGGTIAFITGIYERLIKGIKSFDLEALKLLLRFDLKGFAKHTDLLWLGVLFAGVGVSVVSLAKILEYLFCRHEVLTLAFFFGLILASVYLVGKHIGKWNVQVFAGMLIGTAIAVGIGFLNPANANESMGFVFICGMVAISSMILPGLSGSYVLLLMGNYLLILGAISDLNLKILLPFAIGCAIGLVVFSNLLAWLFDKARELVMSLLTGFVLGSLYIIWPWKHTEYKINGEGLPIDKKGLVIAAEDLCKDGIVLHYDRFLPGMEHQLLPAILLTLAGVGVVFLIEYLGKEKPQKA
jgi:putative membrane protein